jgi:hypothetical protein
MKRKEKKSEVVKVAIDPVNEAVMLAAVIVDEQARQRYANLPSDYFFGAGHPEMWAGVQEMFRRGLDYSVETMQSIAGGAFDVQVLDEYVRARPSAPANLAHHVKCLRWDKTRAEAARGVVPLFIEALRDPVADPDRVKSLARQIGQSFTGHGDLRYLRDSHSVVTEHAHELRARRAGRAVYPFGIRALDFYGSGDKRTRKIDGVEVEQSLEGHARMVPGLAPGLTTAVTGLSGSGKTTLTAQFVLAQAELGKKVLWGAWEQMPGMSLELVALQSLGISRTDFMSGRFTEDDERTVLEEMERLGQYIKFFELPFGRARGDKGEHLNDRNLDLIHQYVAESQCQLFIADVFRYALHEQRPDEESMAIKRMNAIGKEQRCHIMLINHLSLKDVERRDDKRPTRDVVMGSSGWINDTDNVIATHLRGSYESVPNDKIEIHILKQRYGTWPQVVECEWDPEYGHVGEGQTIELAKPGERGVLDEFLDERGARHEKPRTKGGKQWSSQQRR